MFHSIAEAANLPLPIETVKFIDEQCAVLGLARGKYLAMLLEEYPGTVGWNLACWHPQLRPVSLWADLSPNEDFA